MRVFESKYSPDRPIYKRWEKRFKDFFAIDIFITIVIMILIKSFFSFPREKSFILHWQLLKDLHLLVIKLFVVQKHRFSNLTTILINKVILYRFTLCLLIILTRYSMIYLYFILFVDLSNCSSALKNQQLEIMGKYLAKVEFMSLIFFNLFLLPKHRCLYKNARKRMPRWKSESLSFWSRAGRSWFFITAVQFLL